MKRLDLIRHLEGHRCQLLREGGNHVLPNATHVTLMEKGNAIIPMVNDFLDAKSQKK